MSRAAPSTAASPPPNTDMVFHGPAAGTAYLATPYSTNGSHGRGTINNCANGHTGWASVLTCEEKLGRLLPAFGRRRPAQRPRTDRAQPLWRHQLDRQL
ncbi:alkaline phosphatase PhoX [Novosphingobium colocasiae]